MPRYVAFLRGVITVNARMTELKRTFEEAGFVDVKTVLSSGNIAFNAPAETEEIIARQVEAAMVKHLGRTFYTIVRLASYMSELVEEDPFTDFNLAANAKQIIMFLGVPPETKILLPNII